MSWTMFYIFHMFRVENKLISGTQILQTVDESANKLTFSSLFELLTSSQSPCCHETRCSNLSLKFDDYKNL